MDGDLNYLECQHQNKNTMKGTCTSVLQLQDHEKTSRPQFIILLGKLGQITLVVTTWAMGTTTAKQL